MLDRLCCMRLKLAGYVFGWIDVAISIIFFAIFLMMCLDSKIGFSGKQYQTGLFLMGLSSIKFVVSVVLLMGVKKQRHQLLVPWLIFSALQLIVLVFASSVAIGFSFLFNHNQSILTQFLIFLVIVVPSWLLATYILYGIYSLYKEIQDYREQQANQFSYVQCRLPSKQEEF